MKSILPVTEPGSEAIGFIATNKKSLPKKIAFDKREVMSADGNIQIVDLWTECGSWL